MRTHLAPRRRHPERSRSIHTLGYAAMLAATVSLCLAPACAGPGEGSEPERVRVFKATGATAPSFESTLARTVYKVDAPETMTPEELAAYHALAGAVEGHMAEIGAEFAEVQALVAQARSASELVRLGLAYEQTLDDDRRAHFRDVKASIHRVAAAGFPRLRTAALAGEIALDPGAEYICWGKIVIGIVVVAAYLASDAIVARMRVMNRYYCDGSGCQCWVDSNGNGIKDPGELEDDGGEYERPSSSETIDVCTSACQGVADNHGGNLLGIECNIGTRTIPYQDQCSIDEEQIDDPAPDCEMYCTAIHNYTIVEESCTEYEAQECDCIEWDSAGNCTDVDPDSCYTGDYFYDEPCQTTNEDHSEVLC